MTTLQITDSKTYVLTAQEDIGYRLANSYPKDGFFVAKGDSIRVLGSGVKLLTVRKWGTRQRGRYKLQEAR